ncbi:MAG: penicillin acylase family protein [Gammaproteobacteria bacterium]
MKISRKWVVYPLLVCTLVLVIGIGACFILLRLSLPQLDGEAALNGISAPVTVTYAEHGVPAIGAENRLDAILALGYVTAQDRLFQMDLLRRKSAGRLAELFGALALDSDVRARVFGFSKVANAAWSKLSQRHRRYLEAYAQGVNRYIEQAGTLPFEFSVLGYRPEPWSAQDSILVLLGMFDRLTARAEDEERMLSVMAKTLPEAVVAFLTPDTDRYTDQLTNHAASYRPARPVPVEAMASALAPQNPDPMTLAAVRVQDSMPGSNAWAVSGAKTQDGRAILANDMHLGISVPNIWYRTEIQYGNVHVAGVTLPGIPTMVAGSNEHVAWGATNLAGDFLDLVSLELNPENPDEYRVGHRWQRFENVTETIAIKGGEARTIELKRTLWGPVAPEPLLGHAVAIHWTALDAEAVNVGMIDLEQSESLEQALDIANLTGGPQLNFMAADDNGRIAWTILGRIPQRYGIDGSVSRSWADGAVGWNGYLDPAELPRQLDAPDGLLVSANDRRLGKHYPHVIGRQFTNGYRAYRISQRLHQMPEATERSMFELQLDDQTEFYRFYQRLALAALSSDAGEREPELAGLRSYLSAWNGKADADSLGFALLVQFRKQLAESVFNPFLSACKAADPNFKYSWTYLDTPLQALLMQKNPQLLPDPVHYRHWDAFILGQLKQSLQELKSQFPGVALSELTWGKVNKAHYRHPFSRVLPWLGLLLDMPEDELSGCSYCVRVAGPGFGASERLVVSPGHLDQGILHMPGGQSSHPLSPYYRDQQRYWVKGLPLQLLARHAEHLRLFKPLKD